MGDEKLIVEFDILRKVIEEALDKVHKSENTDNNCTYDLKLGNHMLRKFYPKLVQLISDLGNKLTEAAFKNDTPAGVAYKRMFSLQMDVEKAFSIVDIRFEFNGLNPREQHPIGPYA